MDAYVASAGLESGYDGGLVAQDDAMLGAIRVVAQPTEMLLYSERGFVQAALMRAAGTMEGIVGSGGVSWISHTPDFVDIEMR